MRFASVLLFLYTAAAQVAQPAFDQARALYYRGSDGDKRAYAEADRRFTDLYRQDPHDPRVEAYYGSLRLLEASSTWALWKKNSLSKQGIQLLDSAVSAAPRDLDIRFVRAITTYALPDFFHRKQQSKDDFALLAREAPEAVRSKRLEPRLAAASLYYHGEFLKDAGDMASARSSWQESIRLAPDSRAARESRAALAR
jgi:tetratricopeptide (TPR) repeat protein